MVLRGGRFSYQELALSLHAQKQDMRCLSGPSNTDEDLEIRG